MSLFKKLFKSNPENFSRWSDLGTLKDGFEIQYLHPDHHSYPAWPGGDRHLKLLKTKWNTEIIFSEGLDDVDGQNNYEIYLETNEEIEDFGSSWQANLVYAVGRIIPNLPDLATRFAKNKYLTVQVQVDEAPQEWSLTSPDGNIGLFLGLDNPNLEKVKFPFAPICIKLMRPQELLYAVNNGTEGRNLLASLYVKQGGQTLSFLDRASIL